MFWGPIHCFSLKTLIHRGKVDIDPKNLVFLRNSDKKDALSTNSLVVLILKIIFDSVSRILIFGIWMFVINKGQFSTTYTVIGYYAAVMALVVFNLCFSWDRQILSSRFWIGKY